MQSFRPLPLALVGMLVAAAAPAPPLDRLLDGAERGEVEPIERALAETSDDDTAVLLRATLAAARLDPALDPALPRLAEGSADPVLRRAALRILASAAFSQGDYGAAARWGRPLEALLTEAGEMRAAEEAARMRGIAELLAGHPAQAVDGPVAAASVPLHYDRVGLPRIAFGVNGATQEAVVDTGANLSVLSRETARRLGVAMLDAERRVGNGVEGTVAVRVGVADRVEIAGTVLRNVAFLIIDDEQLTFPLPGGYDIRAIIGLPVLKALGRVRVENAGRFAVLPAAGAGSRPSNLHASGNDLFVDVAVAGETLPLHLDTGANLTSLSARYAGSHPDIVERLEARALRTASAGGTRQAQAVTWPQVELSLAGRTLRLPDLSISLPAEGSPPRFHGTLGSNALRAFESYTIDFTGMRLDLGEPAAAPAPAPRAAAAETAR